MPSLFSVKDLINWVGLLHLSSLCQEFLEAVFYTLWWSIWSCRNSIIFCKIKPKKCLLFDKVVSESVFWANSRCCKTNVNCVA